MGIQERWPAGATPPDAWFGKAGAARGPELIKTQAASAPAKTALPSRLKRRRRRSPMRGPKAIAVTVAAAATAIVTAAVEVMGLGRCRLSCCC